MPSGRCSSIGGASRRADTVRSTWPGPGVDDASSDGFAAGSAQYVARSRRRKWDGSHLTPIRNCDRLDKASLTPPLPRPQRSPLRGCLVAEHLPWKHPPTWRRGLKMIIFGTISPPKGWRCCWVLQHSVGHCYPLCLLTSSDLLPCRASDMRGVKREALVLRRGPAGLRVPRLLSAEASRFNPPLQASRARI